MRKDLGRVLLQLMDASLANVFQKWQKSHFATANYKLISDLHLSCAWIRKNTNYQFSLPFESKILFPDANPPRECKTKDLIKISV